MVFELKKPTNRVPGLLVFSHKEYIRFLNTKVAKFLLNELKENYFIGIHWGASFKTIPINKQVDIHFSLPGLLPNISELEEKIIPLTTRNFTPNIFSPQKDVQKDWDIITIGRKVKAKRYLEFFLIIKKVLEKRPETKILIIAPEYGFPNKSTYDFLFEENFVQIFNEEEKKQINIHSQNGFLDTTEIIHKLNKSKTFLFTSVKEGVAKVTAEAALCGLKILIYKDFIGSFTHGIVDDQLYLYKDIDDASSNLIKFIEENQSYYPDETLLREEHSITKLHKYLDKFYSLRGFNYDHIINSTDLRRNLNSFNKTLPDELVIGNSNDIKDLKAFLGFCELHSIDVNFKKKILVSIEEFLLKSKDLYRKRRNLFPLFIWKIYRRRTQYNKLAI